MPTLEDVLAELAAAPPTEFTQTRDQLVIRLTKLGQTEVATRVKAMRRPTAALWVANRVAREDHEAIERLIAAIDRMRAAQLGSGAGDGDFAKASADQRAALAHLTQHTEVLLKQAGLGATHQVLARVETTLAEAAADPELRPALQQGRLERELAARGFDVFAGEELPPRQPAPAATSAFSPAPQPDRNREREARLHAARESVAQAEVRATQQRSEAASARQRVEELTRMLRDAQRRETEAAGSEKKAEAELRAAREALRAAEQR